jgi:hypothetical protein
MEFMKIPGMLTQGLRENLVTNRYKWFSRNCYLHKELSGLVLILVRIMLLFGADKKNNR